MASRNVPIPRPVDVPSDAARDLSPTGRFCTTPYWGVTASANKQTTYRSLRGSVCR
ncbi:hypothetical protein [Catenulispora subtropica]|uniref:hypothetical protein n=1 Tax=Catenulispora subtropica TaxID=450798 RepID=UPI0031D53294